MTARSSRFLWACAALALAIALALAAARFFLGPQVPVEKVVQRDFAQTVVASGRVETPHRVDVGVQIVGTVSEVPVMEGQKVTSGTPLIRLESSELRAAAEQADLAVRQAEARVRQMREIEEPGAEQAVAQARANHDIAARTLQRNRELFEQRFIGQAALEDSLRGEEVAMAQLRTAQQQLAGARPGGSSSLAAEAALAQARAAAAMARARLRYALVSAPVAGTLISRDVEPGAVVQPGKVLMVLSPEGETQLVLQIDEKNLKLLQIGQDALASADAYAEHRFPAKLVYINPGIDPQRGSVEVKLSVPQPPPYLKQDMTVSVDIEVARRGSALLVPAEAVHDADTNAPWVFAVEAGQARRKPVTVGLRSRGWCEIAAGVGAGDEVVVPAAGSAAISDGSRVRPVPRTRS